MGIRSTKKWGDAGALKNLWQIAKDSQWVRWMHARYLKDYSVWTYSPRLGDWWLLKQILKTRDILQPHISWIIGDERNTLLWQDP